MSAERFTEHLQFPQGKSIRPAGGSFGVAGGAVCGDLVSIALRIDAERIAAAGFEASGCGAVSAAGSAVVALVEGAGVLDAARVGTHEIAAELGGLSPGKLHAAELAADALHRALGAAARADAALTPVAGRTLVAMSGGVDSAVAALLSARSGGEVVAVTLELWADEANDAEASCCSAHAVRVARSLAHGRGRAARALGVVLHVGPQLDGHRDHVAARLGAEQRHDGRVDAAAHGHERAAGHPRRASVGPGRGPERAVQRVGGQLGRVQLARAQAAELVGDIVHAHARGLEQRAAAHERDHRRPRGLRGAAPGRVEARVGHAVAVDRHRDPHQVAARRAAGGAVVAAARAVPAALRRGEVMLESVRCETGARTRGGQVVIGTAHG